MRAQRPRSRATSDAFAGTTAAFGWFTHAHVPETKGKSLEEVEALFK